MCAIITIGFSDARPNSHARCEPPLSEQNLGKIYRETSLNFPDKDKQREWEVWNGGPRTGQLPSSSS